MAISADLDSIIFMKVGRHAGETFEDILARKRKEFEKAGMVFWGYGGGTMHPIHRVQPFVRMRVEHGESVSIVMESVFSKHPDTEVFAKEYSRDGVTWEPIPPGVKVRGSRYALVLDEIRGGDLSIDLANYRVGVGPSEGREASGYIRGRVDKGCLVRSQQAGASRKIEIAHIAELKEPFAVLLRS